MIGEAPETTGWQQAGGSDGPRPALKSIKANQSEGAGDRRRAFDADRGKTGFALDLFHLRFRRLRLSQRAFAERYGLGFPAIRDLEQGVTKPTPAMRLIVAAISRDPNGMAEAARDASRARARKIV